MSEAAFTSPRSQRALKRLTVDMDKHKEILNRLNQQSSKLSELRKGSPYSQQSQASPAYSKQSQPSPPPPRYGEQISVQSFEEEGDDIELPWQTQQPKETPPSRETMDADAQVERAALAAENAARKRRQQRIEEADREALAAKERRASRESAGRLAKKEAERKAKEEARKAREAAAVAEALEAERREAEALRLREEEAKRIQEEEEEKRRLSEERRHDNEMRRIASERRAKEEVFKVRAAAEAIVREENEKKWLASTTSEKQKQQQRWFEKTVPVVEYTAEQLPEERQQPDGRPAMSTYRNGWSSTPHMNNKDAYNRDVSGFTSQGLYAWNHYLPKPPPPPNRAAERDEEKVPEPPHRDYAEEEEEEDEEFFVAELPDATEESPVAEEGEDEDDDASSTDSEEEPEWQQTWRRRSEHRRIAFTEKKYARESDSLEYDDRDRLVDEDADRAFVPKIDTSAINSCDIHHETKLAVSEACRSVATEDLDAEVTSYDAAAGLYRVSCTVKVGDGRVVSMATLRDFADFHKVRADILACLDKIPGGRVAAQHGLPKLPKKRLRSLVFAKSRNLIKGKNKGEFKWQAKQLPVLDAWLAAAIAVVAKVKAGDTLHESDTSGSKFSFVSNFNRIDLEDSLKCFLLQGAFFAGVMTMSL